MNLTTKQTVTITAYAHHILGDVIA